MKTTEPFVEFSKGTMPRETSPDCKAWKISTLDKHEEEERHLLFSNSYYVP